MKPGWLSRGFAQRQECTPPLILPLHSVFWLSIAEFPVRSECAAHSRRLVLSRTRVKPNRFRCGVPGQKTIQRRIRAVIPTQPTTLEGCRALGRNQDSQGGAFHEEALQRILSAIDRRPVRATIQWHDGKSRSTPAASPIVSIAVR